jgi:hypothetical protein
MTGIMCKSTARLREFSRKVSIRVRISARLLGGGVGTKVTGAQLCDMYVEEGGKDCNPSRRDHGHGATMFRMQYRLPIRRVSGDSLFSVNNVYEVVDYSERMKV